MRNEKQRTGEIGTILFQFVVFRFRRSNLKSWHSTFS